MESHYVVVAISTTAMNLVSIVMGFGAWMTIGPSCPKAESLTIYLIGTMLLLASGHLSHGFGISWLSCLMGRKLG